jgi:hypothetical protein
LLDASFTARMLHNAWVFLKEVESFRKAILKGTGDSHIRRRLAANRSELAKDFVAEQYDGELDGCIALAESLLTHAPCPKPMNKWLPPR